MIRTIILPIFASISALLLGLQPASAEKIPAVTPLVALTSGVSQSTMLIGRNQAILSARAVYAELAIADQDIVGSDGRVTNGDPLVLARKGDQLFGVHGANGQRTFCTLGHKKVGALNGFFVNNRDKHTCFIDVDRDGRFEASYDLRTKMILGGPPIYFHVETTGNPLQKPIGYTAIDPLSCALDFRLEAFFERVWSKGLRAQLNYRVVTAASSGVFGQQFQVKLPSDKFASLYGEVLTFSPHDEKRLSVHIERGFTVGEFHATHPTYSYF